MEAPHQELVSDTIVNALCLMWMSAEELQPLVFSKWNNAPPLDSNTCPQQLSEDNWYLENPFLNRTSFHDVFGWGNSKYGPHSWPLVFAKLPSDYNTLINDTQHVPYGRTSVYVLGKGGPMDVSGQPTTSKYGLCQLRVGQTPQCSTQYNASSNVGTLEAICEDSQNSLTSPIYGPALVSEDWPNIASMWLRRIETNNGFIDGNALNARLSTELSLTNNSLDYSVLSEPMALSSAYPSPAEALTVMSTCTLMQSAQDGPFVDFWNYSSVNSLRAASPVVQCLTPCATTWLRKPARLSASICYRTLRSLHYQRGRVAILSHP